MSLVGNLEDLSLPDILQIVSLSKKSGILMLEREGQQGKILIRQGKVIQTVSPRPGKTLGELLASRGLLRPDDLKKALEIQGTGASRELLGGILVRLQLIDEASLEKIVQEQIEDAIVFFLSWKEGTFSFELADIPGRGEFSVDPQAFILERGIDTQWLVLEGTRLIDERSRERGTPPPAESPVEPSSETSFAEIEGEAEAPDEGRAVILVDDDPLFREMARDHLGRLGFRLVVCEGGAACLSAVERESGRREPPAVAADIVMPTLDNQGFLGGLELLEKLRRAHPKVPVVAVTAYPDDSVKAQVAELGGAFLLKPGAGDTGGLPAFFDRLAALLGQPGAASAVPAAGVAPSAPAALRQAAVESAPAAAPKPAPAVAPTAEPAPELEPELEPEAEPIASALPAAPPAAAAHAWIPEALAIEQPAAEPAQPALPEEGLDPAEEALLRDMLEELHGPRAASELGLLILRFAAELLNRAVLFVVKGGKAVGLGGFGVEVAGAPERRGVRGIAIPLNQASLLEEVVRSRRVVHGPVSDLPQNRALLEQLGGGTPLDAVALPLVSGGRVRVILYGDNLPESQAVSGVKALERFLGAAGVMLEKALLEKKLQEGGTPAAAPGARREQHVGGGTR